MSWRLAASLETLRGSVIERWPGTTVGAIGNAAHCPGTSDHCPNAQGVVRAIDVMNPAAADVLWDDLQKRRDQRFKYGIHDAQIVSSLVSPWQVRRYTGPNPHTHHLHISVSNRAVLYDDPSPWNLEDDMPLDDDDLAKIRVLVREEILSVVPANLESEIDRLRRGQRGLAGERKIDSTVTVGPLDLAVSTMFDPIDLGPDGP